MKPSRADIALGSLIVVVVLGFLIGRSLLGEDELSPTAGQPSAAVAATTDDSGQEPDDDSTRTAPEMVILVGGDEGDEAAGSDGSDDTPGGDQDEGEIDPSIYQEETFPAQFRVGEASPHSVAAAAMARFSRRYARCPGTLVVMGHTDASGAKGENRRISEDRARFVRAMLMQHGADEGAIKIRGLGSRHPAGPNETPEGRGQNRRVSVICQQ